MVWNPDFPDLSLIHNRIVSPLYYASMFGLSKAVVRLLLETGVDVNAQGGRYGNALRAASFHGGAVVRLLLKTGADVNEQGGKYGNALQTASLDHGKNLVRRQSKDGTGSPLPQS